MIAAGAPVILALGEAIDFGASTGVCFVSHSDRQHE